MAVEEKKCNGFVKLEDSSGEGLITYKRRKRGRSSSDAGQVREFCLFSCTFYTKDWIFLTLLA